MASRKQTRPRKKAARKTSTGKTSTGKKTSKKQTPRADKRAEIASDSNAARIIAAIKRIPRGKVSTYGDIAEMAGLPRRARLVGTVLRQMPDSRGVPWFRVINASGRISFPLGSAAYERQRKHLEAEGVDFVGGRVDLNRYGWPSREKLLDELLWGPPT